MSSANDWDPKCLWAPYAPDARAPWDLRRVVHLHRRAGFAATWNELQRDLVDGPERSVTRLLRGQARGEGVAENFTDLADQLATLAQAGQGFESTDGTRLKAWWFFSMYRGPDPLGERLTLLWHNHFATSNAKVNDLTAMWRQNEIFRRHARAPFGDLLGAVIHDPALLIWLDAQANRKGHPNENLARELMELFTLGIGHYTEAEVKDAARALTGWKVTQGAFRAWVPEHDDGEKTLFGHTGRWKGDDLVRLLLEHPATARRLAWRLCDSFLGENAADPAALDALAAGLRRHHLDIGWAVETVLRSRRFFVGAHLGNQVGGPAEFLVGAARALEWFDPPLSSLLLAEWCTRLGQDLFYPPNVGGWAGGRDWLNSQAIIGRANFAADLVQGRLCHPPTAWDGVALARRHGRAQDLDSVLGFYAELWTGAPPEPAWLKRVKAALGRRAGLQTETVNAGVALLLDSPEAQLA